jgi:thiol-disulfide isomerase/thioredoxin
MAREIQTLLDFNKIIQSSQTLIVVEFTASWCTPCNTNSPKYVDFPDSLEITFLRKDYPLFNLDKSEYPIDKLDFPNYDGREDYVLNWWI